jgi:hypothetical protein
MKKDLKLFGFSASIEVIVVLLLVGILIGSTFLCFCVSAKEAYENMGADLTYLMGSGVKDSQDDPKKYADLSKFLPQKPSGYSDRPYYWY